MPYISRNDDRREKLRNGEPALIAGELNYQIFYYIKHNNKELGRIDKLVIKAYVDQFLGEKPNYQKYNDMTGALVRCAKEIYRRLDNTDAVALLWKIMDSYDDAIAKYEDVKIKSNGDVE